MPQLGDLCCSFRMAIQVILSLNLHLAVSKGVIVFVLPPHTTHLCQPLDLTCFHSLKSYWDEECDKYMVANPGKVVTVYQFSQLFSAAWVKAMTPQTIISGFRTTGIYPVNRDAIHIPGDPSKASAVTPMTAIAKTVGFCFFHCTVQPHPRKKFLLQQQNLLLMNCNVLKDVLRKATILPLMRSTTVGLTGIILSMP